MGAEPFLLSPAGKDYLWGGRRLKDDFSKEIDMEPLAESWECSTHSDGLSVVSSGEFEGMFLLDVLKMHKEFLGTNNQDENGELPILVKLIDANKDLSIQVHPDDEYAKKHENGGKGKTEMWYVLDAAKNATLIYGFYNDVTKEQIKNGVQDATVMKYMQKVPVSRDDVFYIKAGQVHAIGAGVLIAEIQQNSNITYRLYDYDRLDKNGHKRQLNVDKALEVANLSSSATPVQPVRVLRFHRGYATDLLCHCRYFHTERVLLNTERCRQMAEFSTKSSSFEVFLCIKGCGTLYWENGGVLNFYKGDCIFAPADSVKFSMHGRAQLLKINC